MKKRINKKAALELSVNAIVILILAIVMLGLGLGFVTGMFGKMGVKIEEQISKETEPPAPSRSDTITLSRTQIITNPGATEVLKVGVLNPTEIDWNSTAYNLTMNCTGSIITPSNLKINQKEIKAGESVTYDVLFAIPKGKSSGSELCKVAIINSSRTELYSEDFAISIKT